MDIISGQKLYSWYLEARKQAIAQSINPDEVDWLLQALTDLSSLSLRLGLFQNRAEIETRQSLSQIHHLWQQRLQDSVPVQYLAETVFWRRFQLKVTPATLIPRPETELIIDIAREAIQHPDFTAAASPHWVDLGTGSGAIALGLADSMPQATIHAVDCSSSALEIARENAKNLGLENRIKFYCGNWWHPLEFLQHQVTGMISNPPYIPTAEVQQLQPEVVKHEPHLALDGGIDGLDDIRYLVQSAPQYLAAGGIWLIELMVGQADAVVGMLERQGEYYDIKVFTDFNGIERFVLAYRN